MKIVLTHNSIIAAYDITSTGYYTDSYYYIRYIEISLRAEKINVRYYILSNSNECLYLGI